MQKSISQLLPLVLVIAAKDMLECCCTMQSAKGMNAKTLHTEGKMAGARWQIFPYANRTANVRMERVAVMGSANSSANPALELAASAIHLCQTTMTTRFPLSV